MSVVFMPQGGLDLHACRAVTCLAFAVRARNSHPATTDWALGVCGLSHVPADVGGAARTLTRPDYRLAGNQARAVVYSELASPLATGMRLILEPLRTRATKAEHLRIAAVIRYVAPVITHELPHFAQDFQKFADYLCVDTGNEHDTTETSRTAGSSGAIDCRRPESAPARA